MDTLFDSLLFNLWIKPIFNKVQLYSALKGGKICFIDFSNLGPEDIFENIKKAESLIASQPMNSVLTLTNVINTDFNEDITDGLKEFTAHNKPYVKKGAVVGVKGLQKVVYQAVISFSKRDLSLFDNVDDAKDWLMQ